MKAFVCALCVAALFINVQCDPIRKVRLSPVGECPAVDGPTPTYLPDAEDCGIFYQCNSGHLTYQTCPPTLCFDTTLNVCVFPESKRSVRSPVGKCYQQDAPLTMLPDDSDCSIYYVCSGGSPIEMHCPTGLEYNPSLRTCDYPWNAGCTAGKEETK